VPDTRALAPVVGKGLEAAIVLLYVAGLATTLHGGVLPEYRAETAVEVSDRTLVSVADRIDAAVPPRGQAVTATRTVDLPDTIAGSTYRIRADDATLSLDHPDPRLSGRVRLALPGRVVSVQGVWASDDPAVVRVTGTSGRVEVTLE
jgi:hypothetical protein